MDLNDDFFNAVGLMGASDDQKAELTEQLTQIVQNRIAARLVEVLTVHELEHFDQLLETEGDEAAYAYLLEAYPDYTALLDDEVRRVKAALSQDVAAVGQVAEQMLADSKAAESQPNESA